jgi:FAD synthetase
MESKRVLAFGTFDDLHPGHLFFLRSAKSRGTHLIVGVARDAHVKELKDKRPHNHERKRLEAVEKMAVVDEAYLSDKDLGSYEIIAQASPDLIVLGHDQKELESSLLEWMQGSDHYIPMLRIKKL